MSDSVSVVSRVAVVMFFIAAAAGVYGFITHSRLAAAERQVVTLQQERDVVKSSLITTEKAVTQSSAAAQTCKAEAEGLKTRADTAEATLESLKSKTPAGSPEGKQADNVCRFTKPVTKLNEGLWPGRRWRGFFWSDRPKPSIPAIVARDNNAVTALFCGNPRYITCYHMCEHQRIIRLTACSDSYGPL